MTRIQIERLIAEIENELVYLERIKAQVEEAHSRFGDTEPDGFGIQGVALVMSSDAFATACVTPMVSRCAGQRCAGRWPSLTRRIKCSSLTCVSSSPF